MSEIEIDDETLARINAEAAARGVPPGAVVADAMRLLLKRYEDPPESGED